MYPLTARAVDRRRRPPTQIHLELLPESDAGFELAPGPSGSIVLRGSTGVALASALVRPPIGFACPLTRLRRTST
jgi:hypothetical protein